MLDLYHCAPQAAVAELAMLQRVCMRAGYLWPSPLPLVVSADAALTLALAEVAGLKVTCSILRPGMACAGCCSAVAQLC